MSGRNSKYSCKKRSAPELYLLMTPQRAGTAYRFSIFPSFVCRILSLCTISIPDIKCEYIFVFLRRNSARKWLNTNRYYICWQYAIPNMVDDRQHGKKISYLIFFSHDDVIKWKHFPRYWPFVRGIHRSPVNSPHKCQWRGALMFSLICAWINGWVNNGETGGLRRHRAHYDVIVMLRSLCSLKFMKHIHHAKIRWLIGHRRTVWANERRDICDVFSLCWYRSNVTLNGSECPHVTRDNT